MTSRGLGYLPDAADVRDWRYAAPRPHGPLPLFIGRLPTGPVLDQGALQSCVAHAVASAIWASHRSQGVARPRLLSRLALYYLARASHGMSRYDSGTYLRSAFRALNALGFAPEDAWPYSPPRFAEMPPTRLFRLAHDQTRPTRYRRIFERGEERVAAVKRAIAGGSAVVFGTLVGEDFVADRFDPARAVQPPTGRIAGGHAMLWAGYSASGPDTLSSWGASWADGGWCRLGWDYVAWAETRDLWVVEHAPPYSDLDEAP